MSPVPRKSGRSVAVTLLLSAFAIGISVAVAQSQGSAVLAYDVVTIKPSKSLTTSSSYSRPSAEFQAVNASIKSLLVNTYGIREGLIVGLPPWALSERFDIHAKVSDPDMAVFSSLTTDQRHVMLANLLADRFHLKVHTEIKTLPVYELVPAKGGPKFNDDLARPPADPNKPATVAGNMLVTTSTLTSNAIPMSSLAGLLAQLLDRTVIDKTGLTGQYDLRLNWTPDDSPATTDDAPPSLLTALQEQLGLKLQSAKGPVPTLVVDHIERPAEN